MAIVLVVKQVELKKGGGCLMLQKWLQVSAGNLRILTLLLQQSLWILRSLLQLSTCWFTERLGSGRVSFIYAYINANRKIFCIYSVYTVNNIWGKRSCVALHFHFLFLPVKSETSNEGSSVFEFCFAVSIGSLLNCQIINFSWSGKKPSQYQNRMTLGSAACPVC